MKSQSGLSLNDVTCNPPGVVPDMRTILLKSRTHKEFSTFDIKKFFCSVRISERDSYLRLILVPAKSFCSNPEPNPTWTCYRDCAIPFGDSPSGDYANCAKFAACNLFIDEVPDHLRTPVRQAIIENTYVDDGAVGANSKKELSLLETEITTLLKKGGFEIKGWERSGKPGISKYLGVTWNKQDDTYQLKFNLNLSKKFRGLPIEEDISLEKLSQPNITVTKRNVLSVCCQFFDPSGLGSPLVFAIRSLYSSLCINRSIKMESVLTPTDHKKFIAAVTEMLSAKSISFPRQIIFNYSCSIHTFFDGSLQGYGAAVYCISNQQSNLLTSCCKIMGKSSFSAPQSEICAANLAVKMVSKILEEFNNISILETQFIGDSEIVIRMIGKQEPSALQTFYGTRVMSILASTTPDQWFWCPGSSNPADLLTRSSCSAKTLGSPFWLNGGFLTQPRDLWPIKTCKEISTSSDLPTEIKTVNISRIDPLSSYISELLEKAQSLTKVKNALSCILKLVRRNLSVQNKFVQPWNTAETAINKLILSRFQDENVKYLASHKLKQLVTSQINGIWYVSDRSFRARSGVPLIPSKTILAQCIIKDAHRDLGHARDYLQVLSHLTLRYFIPGARKLIYQERKKCAGCARINPKNFQAFEKDIPNNLKRMNPPFTYCQSDIFGPETIFNTTEPEKRWILITICLSSRAIHMEPLHTSNSNSITMAFTRLFSIRGTPKIIWIDAGLNIIKSGREIAQNSTSNIPGLNLKFQNIEFRSTLPKHHEGVGAVERIIRNIKNTVSKSIPPPSKIKMNDEEFATWLQRVTQKINDRPLVLGMPPGISITPNHVLHGFSDEFIGETEDIHPPINQQLQRRNNVLDKFGSVWEQEFASRRYNVVWNGQRVTPKVGDLVLIKNEPHYKHQFTIARITTLLAKPSGDIYAAKVQFRRNLGGSFIEVERHLRDLAPFIEMETSQAEENLPNIRPDHLTNNSTLPAPSHTYDEVIDEINQGN